MFIVLFLEKGSGERERKKNRCERETLTGYLSYMFPLGTKPAAWAWA